jgi:glycosyltransferase involved in cell wall biosynthesis
VKGSRAAGALCAVEAYVHSGLGLYRRHVAAFIAPSRFVGAKAAEFGMDPARISYVPNFVEPPSPIDTSTGRYVLYAGRLERVKGLRTLIEAFSRSAHARTYELFIAGDGEDRPGLEKHAAGRANIRFTGHLPQAEVWRMIDGAALTVTPSGWYENAPLSVMESAARGKAAIVSDLGGLPELVKHGETGLVFRAGDPAALTAALDELLADPARAAEMGRRAAAFMKETFGPERHYKALLDLYERVLSSEKAVLAKREVAT